MSHGTILNSPRQRSCGSEGGQHQQYGIQQGPVR